jgi:hypothetical protein
MVRTKRGWILVGCIALYLLGLGFLSGMATERIWFDQRRAESIRQYDEALRRWQAHLMRLEQGDALAQQPQRERAIGRQAEGEPTWVAEIRRVETALGRGDVAAAERALRDARMEAIRTGGWEPMIEVGNAAVRIGKASGKRDGLVPQARRAYLKAFFRARRRHSREGMLSAADGFAAIGDQAIAEQCRRAAGQ